MKRCLQVLGVALFSSAMASLGAPVLAQGKAGEFLTRIVSSSSIFSANVRALSMSVDGERVLIGLSSEYNAQVWVRQGEGYILEADLVPSDLAPGWLLGRGVALNATGTLAAVGAPGASVAGVENGAVYVFQRSGSSWTQMAQLVPSLATSEAQVGTSVSLDAAGNTLIAGAIGDSTLGFGSGAAYVFEFDGTTWNEAAQLLPTGDVGSTLFGIDVRLSGDGQRAAATAPLSNGFAGNVYVYTKAGGWAEEAKLEGNNGNFFGSSVDLSGSGDRLVTNSQAQGFAHVFERSGSTWFEDVVLPMNNSGKASMDWLGTTVLAGDLLYELRQGMWSLRDTLSENVACAEGSPAPSELGEDATRAVVSRSCDGVLLYGPRVRVPLDTPTIQGGIDSVEDGGEVLVDAGTYVENINFAGKQVAVRSVDGSSTATIQGVGGTVVSLTSGEGREALLSGFTITGGSGSGGAGMLLEGTSPTIQNCAIVSNFSTDIGGGLLACSGAEPLFQQCSFDSNEAQFGGGFALRSGAEPTFEDTSFSGNQAVQRGGAGDVESAFDFRLLDCSFDQNEAVSGGALAMLNAGVPTIRGCAFSGNLAITGGAILSDGFVEPQIDDCRFEGNIASGDGGAIADRNLAFETISDCLFVGNQAQRGGALSIGDNSIPTLVNLTLANNLASQVGGGIYLDAPILLGANLILWGNQDAGGVNEAAQLTQTLGSLATLDFSNVQGGWSGAGSGNLNVDPSFREPTSGDYRLANMSPLVDLGDASSVAPSNFSDLEGLPRVNGAGPDLGAYEYHSPCEDYIGDDTYCTAKTNSLGCVPSVSTVFSPGSQGFEVTASNVLNNKAGFFFYGLNGRAELPFLGGTLCVMPPLRRTPLQISGGNIGAADCSGTYTFNLLTWFLSGADVNLVEGSIVNGQFWSRDPQDALGVGLTAAVEIEVCAGS